MTRMTRNEKEQIIVEVIQRLKKNKGFDLKINRIWADSGYINVEIDYVADGNKRRQQFGFTSKWFDPNYFDLLYIKDLQIPANINDHEKVVLKIAYYFYKYYKRIL